MKTVNPLFVSVIVLLVLVTTFALGYWLAARQGHGGMSMPPANVPEREVLYWYDPMVPLQRFDQPGPSPFMDMDLVPRYADDANGDVVRINPTLVQNLGVRLAIARGAEFSTEIDATGILQYNRRLQTDMQLRTGGYVEQAWPLAEGDTVEAGQALLRMILPEWSAAQQDFLAALRTGNANLLPAARERLRLLGMPETEMSRLEQTGQAQQTFTLTAPGSGVLEYWNVRPGMTLARGDSIAGINGIETLWLEAAVPESYLGQLQPGDQATIRLAARELTAISATVEEILPALDTTSRTLRVRLLLPNPGNILRPGASARVSLTTGQSRAGVAVPTEALIRTGQRTLVMLAEDDGGFRPVEVTPGRESGEETLILEGLQDGQRIVRSGQFLLDSEASLLGIVARLSGASDDTEPGAEADTRADTEPQLHEADARVTAVDAMHISLEHDPFPTLPMPAMTMRFPVSDAALLEDLAPGDTVRAGVRQRDDGLFVEMLRKTDASPDDHGGH